VNNAAIDVTAPLLELQVRDWQRVLATNLFAPLVLCKHAAEVMSAQPTGGHVVNIASTASKRAWPNASAYHATKWGLLGMSHALHAELRAHRIRVTAVVAGGMRTPFLLDRFPDIDIDLLQEPRNVAQAVRFVLEQPEGTCIPEIMVLPSNEGSWP
jgi:NAD(P)-dependent dehydrogenase (short-subunit alcohol dehydrogenase family)